MKIKNWRYKSRWTVPLKSMEEFVFKKCKKNPVNSYYKMSLHVHNFFQEIIDMFLLLLLFIPRCEWDTEYRTCQIIRQGCQEAPPGLCSFPLQGGENGHHQLPARSYARAARRLLASAPPPSRVGRMVTTTSWPVCRWVSTT